MLTEMEDSDESGGAEARKAPQPLDSLTKEELVAKCKTFLSLAQKAKQAKDDSLKKEEKVRQERDEFKNNFEVLSSKQEDLEDILKSKQRKLERLETENDGLLKQIESYDVDLKAAKVRQNELVKTCNELSEKCKTLEKSSSKAMEQEANLICLRENEKKLTARTKQAEDRNKVLEEAMAIEKKLGVDKNAQIKSMDEKIKAGADDLEKTKEKLNLSVAELAEVKGNFDKLKAEFTSMESHHLVQNEILKQSIQTVEDEGLGIKETEEEMMKTVKENEELRTSLQQLKESLTDKIAELTKEKKVLELTNEGLIGELNELNGEMKKRGERLAKLEEDISEKIRKLDETGKNLVEREKLEVSCTQLKKENEEMDSKLRNLTEELKENQQMVESQKKEISSLDFELSELRVQMEKKEVESNKKNEGLEEEKMELLTENSHLKKNCITLNVDVEKLKENILTLEKQLDSSSKEMDLKSKEVQNLGECIKDLELKCESTENRLISIEKEKTELQTSLDDTSKDVELELLKETVKNMEAIHIATSHENSALKVRQKEIDEELKATQEKFAQHESELETRSNHDAASNSDLEEISSKLLAAEMALSAEKVSMGKTVKELDEIREKLGFSNQQNTDFQEQVKNLELSLGEKDEILKELERNLEEKNANTKESFDNMEKTSLQEKEKLLEKISDLEKALVEMRGMKENLDDVVNKLSIMEQNKASLEKNYEVSVMNHKQAMAELEEKKIQIESLVDLQTDLLNKDEEIKNLQDRIQSQELQLEHKQHDIERLGVSLAEAHLSVSDITASLVEVKKSESELTEKVNDLSDKLSVAEKKCEELIKELDGLKQNGNQSYSEQDDSRSEVMSTSTVSRVEDLSRMKDVEDSFEERYSKLKLVAIKLKKKVVDQGKIIEEMEKQAKSKGAANGNGDVSSYKDKIANMSKNFTTLQSQYDMAVDKAESLEQRVKELNKDLELSLSESMANKLKAEEAAQATLAAKTEANKAGEKFREREVEVMSLRVTVENERRERKVLEERVKQSELLECQLKEKTGQNFVIEETMATLKLQVSQLEETLSKEQERADRAQELLTACRVQLTQTEADLSRARVEVGEEKRKLEETVRLLEENREQLADTVSRTEKTDNSERSRRAQLERQLSTVENKLQARTSELKIKSEELDKMSREFENYKLRAQSVLKQAKDKVDSEEKARKQEEMVALENINSALNEKIKSLAIEVRTTTLEKSGLQEEHDRLMERHSLLLQEIAGKEKTWRSKAEEQEARVRRSAHDSEARAEEAARELERVRQKLLQEAECARGSHVAEVAKLKQQLDLAENEIIRLEMTLQKEQDARRHVEERMGTQTQGGGMERLDISQIEREAAEGQEVDPTAAAAAASASIGGRGGVGGSSYSSVTSPLPLEQLLSQSERQDEPEAEVARSEASSRQGGSDRQLAHLSILLAESEAQNSRLEKLAEVLKEEIRTYQRSEERHKHIENLEYVKNVILKFLTLGGEERGRLVPVLATILRLSKEEVAQIQLLAKAEEESSSGGEGWTSYLHLWSNP